MNAIHTDNAPAAIGPYSQAIEVEQTSNDLMDYHFF